MSIALRKPMTIDEFLDWEAQQPLRYEFDGFQPIAMAGGTAAACGHPTQSCYRRWRQAARQTVPVLWQ